ncbi:3'-5' DNA helicase [Diplodia seriata]
MELDPADFSSSPPSAVTPTTHPHDGAVAYPDSVEAAQHPTIDDNVSPIDAANVEDFPSSPPSPARPNAAPVAQPTPFAAPGGDEFDDDDLDDIDESIFQRLVSHGPPVASKPTTYSAQNLNGTVNEIDQELLDLPSDAFSISSMTSPEFQRAGRAQDQAIIVSSQDNRTPAGPQRLAAPLNGLRQTTLYGGSAAVPPSQINKRQNWPAANKDEPPTHHKIDLEAMKTWVYPTNLGSIREYQFNIVHRGLYHNLLVALPTGLGKTFIAATIMLNFLRWTTEAQIVFVAPTKPLVAQQIDACLGIAGIRRSQTTMLTGEVDPGLRAEEWKTKRVFFMTPQTMINDLKTGYCDAKKIALLVVDEAHRATGAYAYVEIVKFVRRFNQSFRVLALTATPGADVETVQKVIDGLEISRVEIRMENSMDIQPFIHKREVEKKVLRDNKDLLVAKDLFSKAVQPVLDKLNQQNAYWSKDPLILSQFGLNQARASWARSDAGRKASGPVKGMINSIFQALMSLGRGIDVLKFHGLRPFYRILCDYKTDATTKWKKEITNNQNFEKLIKLLRDWTAKPDYIGHPKLEHLREHVLNHFLDAGEGPEGSHTKVMVFAHWRDSAEDIVRVLKLNEPMIRPHVFVGQAATKTSEAMDQRRQEEVVRQFKAGVYNTLVATSIGEEGLDIGEVDLIVCYDQKASPIRMLQRMGRTGRKRKGKILLLQMEGKEENDAFKAKDAYERMQEKISNGSEFKFHTDLARRIVPRGIEPKVEMKHIEIPIENSQPDLPMPRAGKGRKTKRPAKKFQMPDGVITGFISAAGLNGDSDGEGKPRAKKRTKKAPVVEEVEPPVPAEETFLSSHEEKQLQRFYQNIHDADDDREIAPPALTLHPERQRRRGRTKYVSTHSRVTTNFVKMVNRMHAIERSGAKELEKKFRDSLHMSDIEEGPSADEVSGEETERDDEETGYPIGMTPKQPRNRRIMDEVGEGGSSSPPPTDPRMRFRSQAIDLGTQDTEGEDELEDDELPDSELAEFIADDAEAVEMFSSSLPSIRATTKRTKLFTSSDQREPEDSDDDEFPDISQLVGKKKTSRTGKHRSDAVVADSDDDEEDEVAEPIVRQAGKRRRVVDDSDSD